MRTRAAWVARRVSLNVSSGGTAVPVLWTNIAGGTVDAGTGALVGGVETPLSGVVMGFGMIEPPQTVVRTFQEVQSGDLILDLAAQPMVSVYPGQGILSGMVPLDSLADQGVRFSWGGQLYEQAKIGDQLASAWDAIMQGQPMHRTILLRRAL